MKNLFDLGNTEISVVGSQEILGKTVKVYGDFENPLFLAKDVAEWIEHQDVTSMLRGIDETEKVLRLLSGEPGSQGGNPNKWFLTEYGLYEVLMLSRKPIAKEFKRGVKQLLHDLRTGKSQLVKQLAGDQLILAAMNELQGRVSLLQTKIEQDKPKVLLAEAITASDDCILVGHLAKILKQNKIDTGEKRLYKWLRENKYLGTTGSQRNFPTQRSMDMGLFEVLERPIDDSKGNTMTRFTPKVTTRGQEYFINKFLSDKTDSN